MTRIYLNIVVFALKTQHIQRLFKNSIDMSLMICLFNYIFGLEPKVFPVIINTLSDLIGSFQDKI